jgi:LuxR family maltose regulon positive regulatory protein
VPGLVKPLSTREQEVLTLLAAGHPNRAIAEGLVITLDTVKRHLSHVFGKLGVASRTQAIARAR